MGGMSRAQSNQNYENIDQLFDDEGGDKQDEDMGSEHYDDEEDEDLF